MRLLSVLIFCFSLPLAAAPVDENRYFLFRAVKDESIIYLLGSMHMGRPNDPEYPEKIYSALKESRVFILEGEVRKDKIQPPDMTKVLLPDGEVISQQLTAKETERFDKVCQQVKISRHSVDVFEPLFVEFMFGYKLAARDGFSLDFGTEHRLLRRLALVPEPLRPEIVAWENSEEVLGLLRKVPYKEQFRRFRSFLAYATKVADGNIPLMQAVWRRGDGDELWKTYNYADSSLQADDTFNQVFIYGRNERMANRLLDLAQPGKKRGPFFLVTGALHLVGEKSIQSYLGKAGFKIERL